ncbi:MAG: hypothetical protein PHY93_08210 [Bacteriovorax sp.]|nr:hypothetical protein [Bacteriovorax sp.]
MKHSLFFTLLFTQLFLSVACKKINSTSTDPYARNLPFDNAIYLSIPHQEDQSILRRKLLNLNLNNQLKNLNEVDEASKIQDGDEFKFANNSFKTSSLNLNEYEKFRSNAAEVIVSYNDRLEIYFVPNGIERKKALTQLGVAAEPGANFSWLGDTDNFLFKDKIYYLLSASKTNLLENDVHFSQQKISLGDAFNEKMFTFFSNQILELEVNVEYSQKETTLAVLGGQKVKCTHDMLEAGVCDPCNYKLETPTGRLVKKDLESSELVDLDIIINGTIYPFKELNPVKEQNGNFKVILNLKKLIKTERASIQIYQNTQHPISKTVQAVEMAWTCAHKNVSNTIDITPIVKMNLELNVKGRTLNFAM